MDKIIIPLPLITLNQYTNANRSNKFTGAKAKKNATEVCWFHALEAKNKGFIFDTEKMPVDFKFDWYAKNKQTDKDNISFQRKFIFDGFIDAGLLVNDGWQQIGNWEDRFYIDKKNPRVEISIIEMS